VEKDIRQCFAAGAKRVSIDFTEGRLANKNDSRNPWTGKDMLLDFIGLNNRVLDRFSAVERTNIGIHTCPGGDNDSVHSKEVPYEKLLNRMFKLNAGYFLIQCASEEEEEEEMVYKLCGENSREDANGVAQVCFIGVINPLSPDVEIAEEVRDRLVAAARLTSCSQARTWCSRWLALGARHAPGLGLARTPAGVLRRVGVPFQPTALPQPRAAVLPPHEPGGHR